MTEVIKYGLILVALAFASLACGALSGKFCAQASSGYARNLRKDMYYKIQDYSFANIDKFSTSSLVTRLTTDVTNVEMSYMMIIRIAVRAPILLISAMVMAFTISWRMALIFLATTPILTIGLILIIRIFGFKNEDNFKDNTKCIPLLKEILIYYNQMIFL